MNPIESELLSSQSYGNPDTRESLQTVVRNMVSNALKLTPSGW